MLVFGKLNIEARKPFRHWGDSVGNTDLCAVVEDVRTLIVAQDPDMLDVLDKIRQLKELTGSDKLEHAA